MTRLIGEKKAEAMERLMDIVSYDLTTEDTARAIFEVLNRDDLEDLIDLLKSAQSDPALFGRKAGVDGA